MSRAEHTLSRRSPWYSSFGQLATRSMGTDEVDVIKCGGGVFFVVHLDREMRIAFLAGLLCCQKREAIDALSLSFSLLTTSIAFFSFSSIISSRSSCLPSSRRRGWRRDFPLLLFLRRTSSREKRIEQRHWWNNALLALDWSALLEILSLSLFFLTADTQRSIKFHAIEQCADVSVGGRRFSLLDAAADVNTKR